MRTPAFLAILAVLAACTPNIALASPEISKLAINPLSPWLGDNLGVSLDCSDSGGNDIQYVLLRAWGGSVILPEVQMARVSDTTYIYNISSTLLQSRGAYTASVRCINNNSEETNSSLAFTISELTGYIQNVGSPYVGEAMSIYFVLNKDGAPVTYTYPYTQTPSFSISLNGVVVPLKVTPFTSFDYATGRWQLSVDAPSTPGIYTFGVTATYGGKTLTNTTQVSVQNPLTLDVQSLDKTWIGPNDNLTVRLSATYRGGKLPLTNSNLRFSVGGQPAGIAEAGIADNGAFYNVKILPPRLSPGSAELLVVLNNLNYSATISRQITYTKKVSGSISGGDGKGTGVEIRFTSSAADVSYSMDSNGQYSGYLPPNTYTVTVSHANSKLVLYGVDISSFDDPIKYIYTGGITLPGLAFSDLFYYGVSVPFTSSYVELKYDDRLVADEENINVYRCEMWNSGSKVCNQNWARVTGLTVDRVRNTVGFNATSFSAFGIGSERAPAVSFTADKNSYSPGENIRMRGYVTDGGKPLGGVYANMTIKEIPSQPLLSTRSNTSGLFEINTPAPGAEGSYTIQICTDMQPFAAYCGTAGFSVSKSRSLSLTAPDTIKLNWDGTGFLNITVKNKGDADLMRVHVQVTGAPEGYLEESGFDIGDMAASASTVLSIRLSIPGGSGGSVSSLRINASSSEGVMAEKIVALTITDRLQSGSENNRTQNAQITGGVLLSAPQFAVEYIYILFVSAASVASAVLAKRHLKHMDKERRELSSALLDIKKEIYSDVRQPKNKSTKTKKKRGVR